MLFPHFSLWPSTIFVQVFNFIQKKIPLRAPRLNLIMVVVLGVNTALKIITDGIGVGQGRHTLLCFSLKEGFWREAFLSGNSICTQCPGHLWLPGSLKREDQGTEDGGLKTEGAQGRHHQLACLTAGCPKHHKVALSLQQSLERPIKDLKGNLLAI